MSAFVKVKQALEKAAAAEAKKLEKARQVYIFSSPTN